MRSKNPQNRQNQRSVSSAAVVSPEGRSSEVVGRLKAERDNFSQDRKNFSQNRQNFSQDRKNFCRNRLRNHRNRLNFYRNAVSLKYNQRKNPASQKLGCRISCVARYYEKFLDYSASPKICCSLLCRALPRRARSIILPCGSMRMLSGMPSIL